MSGSESPEAAINAIISELGTNLATYMAAIDTIWSDAITLETPALYLRAPYRKYSQYPVVIVEADITQIPPAFRTDHDTQNFFQNHSIQVGVILRSREQVSYQGVTLQPTEVVTIRMERTLHAIQNCLQANPTLTISGTKNCDRLFVLAIPYPFVETVPDQSELFEKKGFINLRVMIS